MLDQQDKNIKFKPTIEWMKENYNKANSELFKNELGECSFSIEPLGEHTLGRFSFQRTCKVDAHSRRIYLRNLYSKEYINKDNFAKLCMPIIKLNSQFSGTYDSWYNTLVHEMCHYYTYMYGYCPKQSHGPEFRRIAEYVAYRSNGQITITRLASPEKMNGYELDGEVKQRQEQRNERKKINATYYIVFTKTGGIELVNTKSEDAVRSMINYNEKKDNSIVKIIDPEITEEFYNRGFSRQFRTYRFWELKEDDPTIQKLINKNNSIEKILNENINEISMKINTNDIEITPNMDLGSRSPIEEGRGEFATFVDDVVDKFNNAYSNCKETIDKHIQSVKESKEYNNLDVRIAWDIARALKYNTWDFLPKDQFGYLETTDAKLTTLFVQALKKSDIYQSVVGDNVGEMLQEKAKSKSQQRFFGMVDAYKKGKLGDDEVSQSVKDAADGMTMKQVKDFAKTKHKGLPNHKKQKTNESVDGSLDDNDACWADREPKNDSEKIKQSRFQGLEKIIDYYTWLDYDGVQLSPKQLEQLSDTCKAISCFGEIGQKWAETGQEILDKYNGGEQQLNEAPINNLLLRSGGLIVAEFTTPDDVQHFPVPTQMPNIDKVLNDISSKGLRMFGVIDGGYYYVVIADNNGDVKVAYDVDGREMQQEKIKPAVLTTIRRTIMGTFGEINESNVIKKLKKIIKESINNLISESLTDDEEKRFEEYHRKIRNGELKSITAQNGKTFSITPNTPQIVNQIETKLPAKAYPYMYENDSAVWEALLIDFQQSIDWKVTQKLKQQLSNFGFNYASGSDRNSMTFVKERFRK